MKHYLQQMRRPPTAYVISPLGFSLPVHRPRQHLDELLPGDTATRDNVSLKEQWTLRHLEDMHKSP